MKAPASRPGWVDGDLFPFESRFVPVDGNLIHHVDEGDGPVLLMLHGNPAWSFLFRDLIAGLRDRFRCVAPDLPGFGLSRARAGYRFTPAEHADTIRAFVHELDLRDITVFVQDWGGPIGLHAAAREPDRYRALVIGNTWAWPVSADPHFARFSQLMGGSAGRLAIRYANAFVNVMVPMGHRRRRPTRAEMAMYRRPFPTRDSRTPTNVFPREIVASSAWLAEVEAGLDRLAHLPALIVWANRDIAFRAAERERFEALFPAHRTHVLEGAGHYLWDDAPDEVLEVFDGWWREVGPGRPTADGNEEGRMHRNEEVVRRLYAAFDANDMTTIDELFADDVVWSTPGRGAHAGRRKGKQELFAAMGRLAELTGGTLRSEIHDVLASEEHAVVLQITRGERDGRASLEDAEAIVFHVRDGRVSEVWEHPGDPEAMDAFFA